MLAALLIPLLAACGGDDGDATRMPLASVAPLVLTATPGAATATATRPAATVTGTPAPPRAATPASPVVGAGAFTATDVTGTCQASLPGDFAPAGNQGTYWTDGAAVVLLLAMPMSGQEFAAFSQTLAPLVTMSQPARDLTVVAVRPDPDRYRAAFVAAPAPGDPIAPYAAAGTLAAVPATGGRACVLEFLYPLGQEGTYAPLADWLVASLRPRLP